MIQIRWATADDAEAIATLLIGEMYPEVGVYLASTINVERIARTILSSIEGEGSICAFSGRRCIGVLNLIRTNWWFSDQEFIADQGFYVSQDARGAIGKKLVEYAQIHAETVGLPCFIFRFNPARARGRVADRLQLAPVVGQAIRL